MTNVPDRRLEEAQWQSLQSLAFADSTMQRLGSTKQSMHNKAEAIVLTRWESQIEQLQPSLHRAGKTAFRAAVAGAPIVGALGQSAPQAAKLCGVAIDPSLERLVTPVVLPLLGGFSESFREVLPVAICVCIAFGAGCAGLGFAAGKRSSRDGR